MHSSLASVVILSPNHSGKRTHVIDTITVHTMACNGSVEAVGNGFAKPSRQASSNYGVDSTGKIGVYVEEENRSWCSSNNANDQRAITIEVASTTSKEPYDCTEAAWKSLVALIVDVCKRYGIKKLVWSTDKNTRVNHLNGCNMTVHRDYAATSCPATYLYANMGRLANEVNEIIVPKEEPSAPVVPQGGNGDMTTEEFTKKFEEMQADLSKEPIPDWAKKEWQEAIDIGITDGTRPMQMIPRVQAAIMAKRAVDIAVEAAIKKIKEELAIK